MPGSTLGFIRNIIENPVYRREKAAFKSGKVLRRLIPVFAFFVLLLIPYFGMQILDLPFDEEIFTIPVFPCGFPHRIYSYKGVLTVSFYFQLIYFIYRSLSLSAPLIVEEKRKKTFSLLISSLLSPRKIILGKFLSVFFSLADEILLFYSMFFLIWFFGFGRFDYLGAMIFTAFSMICIAAASCFISLWASERSANYAKAHSMAFGTAALFIIFFRFVLLPFLSVFYERVLYVIIEKILYLNDDGFYQFYGYRYNWFINGYTFFAVMTVFIPLSYIYYEMLRRRMMKVPNR